MTATMTAEEYKLSQIMEINDRLKKISSEMEAAKAKSNRLKKEHDEALFELLALIDDKEGPIITQIEENGFLKKELTEVFETIDKNILSNVSEQTGIQNVGQLIEHIKSESIDLSSYFTPTEAESIMGMLSKYLAPEGEEWRNYPIGELEGLAISLVSKLEEGGIKTVGDAADFTSQDKDFSDIDGIGEASSEKIKNAITAYLEKRKRS